MESETNSNTVDIEVLNINNNRVGFIIGIYKNEIWLVENIKTPTCDKYGVYNKYLLQTDIDNFFEPLDRDKTIDRILDIEHIYWNGERPENEIETFRLLDLVIKEDGILKKAIKIKYSELESNVMVIPFYENYQ